MATSRFLSTPATGLTPARVKNPLDNSDNWDVYKQRVAQGQADDWYKQRLANMTNAPKEMDITGLKGLENALQGADKVGVRDIDPNRSGFKALTDYVYDKQWDDSGNYDKMLSGGYLKGLMKTLSGYSGLDQQNNQYARALKQGVGAGEAAGREYQSQTGQGTGTTGGAARASLLRALGATRGIESGQEAWGNTMGQNFNTLASVAGSLAGGDASRMATAYGSQADRRYGSVKDLAALDQENQRMMQSARQMQLGGYKDLSGMQIGLEGQRQAAALNAEKMGMEKLNQAGGGGNSGNGSDSNRADLLKQLQEAEDQASKYSANARISPGIPMGNELFDMNLYGEKAANAKRRADELRKILGITS